MPLMPLGWKAHPYCHLSLTMATKTEESSFDLNQSNNGRSHRKRPFVSLPVSSFARLTGNLLYASRRVSTHIGVDMTRLSTTISLAALLVAFGVSSVRTTAQDEISIETGKLRGTTNADKSVRIFKGVPFA